MKARATTKVAAVDFAFAGIDVGWTTNRTKKEPFLPLINAIRTAHPFLEFPTDEDVTSLMARQSYPRSTASKWNIATKARKPGINVTAPILEGLEDGNLFVMHLIMQIPDAVCSIPGHHQC